MSCVPVGENGKPLVLVRNGAVELIPTVQYGNLTIGPAYVEMYVENTPEAIARGLLECFAASQKSLSQLRDAFLAEAKGSGLKS